MLRIVPATLGPSFLNVGQDFAASLGKHPADGFQFRQRQQSDEFFGHRLMLITSAEEARSNFLHNTETEKVQSAIIN